MERDKFKRGDKIRYTDAFCKRAQQAPGSLPVYGYIEFIDPDTESGQLLLKVLWDYGYNGARSGIIIVWPDDIEHV